MARMKMKHVSPTIEESFSDFINSKKAAGLADKTIQTYHYHFAAIGKYLDIEQEIESLSNRQLEKMVAEYAGQRLVGELNKQLYQDAEKLLVLV